MEALYNRDIIAWANEQAALLRSGQFDKLDLANLAEEIEDVGKSEKRELASRLAVLIAHLLKWRFQLERQGKSWELTIKEQRKQIKRRLNKTPSLNSDLNDQEFLDDVWGDVLVSATNETKGKICGFIACSAEQYRRILSAILIIFCYKKELYILKSCEIRRITSKNG